MDSVLALSDKELIAQLRASRENPGPVLPSTRNLYEKKLLKLSKNTKSEMETTSDPHRASDEELNREVSPENLTTCMSKTSPLEKSPSSRDPCFDLLNNKTEDTRLVRHNKTVYKLKMLFHFSQQVTDMCSLEVATYEMEQVFRAVLYIDQRDGEFKPIGTKHFCVFPRKKYWKIAKKLKFSQNNEFLISNPFYFEFNVKPWEKTLEVEGERKNETNLKENEELTRVTKSNGKAQEVKNVSKNDSIIGKNKVVSKKTDSSVKLKSAKVVLEQCDDYLSRYVPKRSDKTQSMSLLVEEEENINDRTTEREEIDDSVASLTETAQSEEKISEKSKLRYSLRKQPENSPRLLNYKRTVSLRNRRKDIKYSMESDSNTDPESDKSIDENGNGLDSNQREECSRISEKSDSTGTDVDEWEPGKRKHRKSTVISSSSGESGESEDYSPGVSLRSRRKKKSVPIPESRDSENYEPEEKKSNVGKKRGKAIESETTKEQPVRRSKRQQKAAESPTNINNIFGNSYREIRKRSLIDSVPDTSISRKKNMRKLYNPLDEPISELPSADNHADFVNLNKTMPARPDREVRSANQKLKKGRPSGQQGKEISEKDWKEDNAKESEPQELVKGDNGFHRKSIKGREKSVDISPSTRKDSGLKDVRVMLHDINHTPPRARQSSESDRLDHLRRLQHSTCSNEKSVTEYKAKDRYVIEREEIEEEMKLQEMSKSSSSPFTLRSFSLTSPRKNTNSHIEEKGGVWSAFDDFIITPAKKMFFRKTKPT